MCSSRMANCFETKIPSEMKVRNKMQIDKINRIRKII